MCAVGASDDLNGLWGLQCHVFTDVFASMQLVFVLAYVLMCMRGACMRLLGVGFCSEWRDEWWIMVERKLRKRK